MDRALMMTIDFLLNFSASYMMELMTVLLGLALVARYVSYRHSKIDEAYFSHFTRELAATLNEDKTKGAVQQDDKEDYLVHILARVNNRLPERNLRASISKSTRRFSGETTSLKDYVGSKHGLIASIQGESSVFSSNVPPNFEQLTDRIMSEDENWSKILGVVPIDGVTRLLDVLPTLFIIFGVFGTFVGISLALPEIAKIDFTNLENSGETLSQFVINVTFAMKSSVAGIFYSIILTLLNTFFPVEASRARTFEKVENMMQLLWYHIHADTVEDQRILKNILKAIEDISNKLKGVKPSSKVA